MTNRFLTEGQKQLNGERIILSTNSVGKIGLTKAKIINLNPNCILHTKMNSKGIIDLNIKCKTTKLWEENRGESLQDWRLGEEFLDMIPEAQAIK